MNAEVSSKIRQYFSAMAIYKDPEKTNSLFTGRNLPSFVKDFLLKRYSYWANKVRNKAIANFMYDLRKVSDAQTLIMVGER